MNKITFTVLLTIFCIIGIKAQKVTTSRIGLQGISFNLKIEELPDTLKTVNAELTDGESKLSLIFNVKNGIVDTSIVLNSIGNFNLSFLGINIEKNIEVRS